MKAQLTRVSSVLLLQGGSIWAYITIVAASLLWTAASLNAQVVPQKFTVVQTTGAGLSFNYLGRTFAVKAGDVIPAGAIVTTAPGTSMVVSPAQGALVSINSGSQVQLVSDDLLQTGREPSNQILLNVISGKLTVNTGPYLSPRSQLAVNTPQGIFSTNNGSFSSASVTTTKNGIPFSTGGVEVDSGRVLAALASGEQIGVKAGQNLVASGSGNNLQRAIDTGKLPDSLAGVVPGEVELQPSDGIRPLRKDTSPNGVVAKELADAMEPTIQKILEITSSLSIPSLLLSPFTPEKKILTTGQQTGMNGEPILPEIAAILDSATGPEVLKELETPLNLLPSPVVGSPTGQSASPTIHDLIQQIVFDSTSALASQSLSLPLSLELLPKFTSQTNSSGQAGSPYSYKFTVDDPSAMIQVGAVPSWLSVSGAVISGTPPAAGIYSVSATATNIVGSSTFTNTISIAAANAPIVSITQTPAGNLTVGSTYTFTINVQASYPYDLSISGAPTWLGFSALSNSSAPSISVTASVPSSAAGTSGTIIATATRTGGTESGTGMLSFVVNPLAVTTGGPTIAVTGQGTESYVAPNGSNTAADLIYASNDTVSSPLPGTNLAAFDAIVTTTGKGGLYWPWSNATLGPLLISMGLRPDGDVFAAYYVYTHYAASGTGSSGTGLTTPGTYTGPGSTFIYDSNLKITP